MKFARNRKKDKQKLDFVLTYFLISGLISSWNPSVFSVNKYIFVLEKYIILVEMGPHPMQLDKVAEIV